MFPSSLQFNFVSLFFLCGKKWWGVSLLVCSHTVYLFVCVFILFLFFGYTVCLFVCLFASLFGKSGGACLCWCVPIPCVAQQMKQLSGDNFSPPHPATLQKLQKDKKFKNYWRTKKIQNKLRIQSKNKSDMWRVHLIVLSVVEFLLHCLSCMTDFSCKHTFLKWKSWKSRLRQLFWILCQILG